MHHIQVKSCSGDFHEDCYCLMTEVVYSTREVLGPADESSAVKNTGSCRDVSVLLCLALLYSQLFSKICLKGYLCMAKFCCL